MNILVLNGSPKGKNSVTVHTAKYLEAMHEEHDWKILHIGQRIKVVEKDFAPVALEIEKSDLVIFLYPVYTFLAPYQMHRFIELAKENGVSLEGKYFSQISTSKHFYDVTAAKYIQQNGYDLGGRYVGELLADMDDLKEAKGRAQADCYFDKMIFDIENGIFQTEEKTPACKREAPYVAVLENSEKTIKKDVCIVTNVAVGNENLQNMIADFQNKLSCETRVVNIAEYPFSGGCLGCFGCASSGKCVYRDGFDEFLRGTIQTADAIVYAFEIKDHYTGSSFKCYDDRQFCNGHRFVTHGMPVGYIIAGDYSKEPLVQTIVEARSSVGEVFLCGVAGDEKDTAHEISSLAKSMDYALSHKMERPKNFWGVGGSKIFRDLVFLMRGMMSADHKFYKKTGVYDFPHKKRGLMLQMQLIGMMMRSKTLQSKMKGKMNDYIVMPYQKAIEEALKEKKK